MKKNVCITIDEDVWEIAKHKFKGSLSAMIQEHLESVCKGEQKTYVSKNNDTKDTVISARVTEDEKELLKQSGYNVRDAIEYFNANIPKKETRINIEINSLKEEIKEYKINIMANELRIKTLYKTLYDETIE